MFEGAISWSVCPAKQSIHALRWQFGPSSRSFCGNWRISDDNRLFSNICFRSRFWPLMILNVPAKYVVDSVSSCYQYWFDTPSDVTFAAYMNKEHDQDVDLQLTCVANHKQDALNDKMKGNGVPLVVMKIGCRSMAVKKARCIPGHTNETQINQSLSYSGRHSVCSYWFLIFFMVPSAILN